MTKQELITEAEKLLDRNATSYLATIDEQGCPAIRGMMIARHEGIKTVWYTSYTSSRKVGNLAANDRACVYVWDTAEKLKALALTGTAQVVTDPEVKRALWDDSALIYYSGPDDPEYCVIRFTAREGDYRHNHESHVFPID